MKILFLEDRPSRQMQFFPNKEKDVEKLKSMSELFLPEAYKCKEIIDQINNKSYPFELSLKLIIAHKSALTTQGLAYLNEICKEKGIKLICFSGGTSQVIFNKDDFEFLNINSSDFYSERLIPFLEKVVQNDENNLLEIVNSQWELSYMLLARQIIASIEIEKDENSKYRLKRKLEQIKMMINIYDEDLLSKEISKKLLTI
ncbi:MAG: hypothetical protein IT232_04210 [Flavobacteriales bacterium]|nr:hypothetical protein [Flavobacteriales bacterium]MCZ2247200.1 hypothetical protein [Bacteroidia bacterium]